MHYLSVYFLRVIYCFLLKFNTIKLFLCWFFRKGMKSYSTNFSLTMLRNYCRLFTLPPLVKLARNMGASLCALRVSLLVWKKSMFGWTCFSSLNFLVTSSAKFPSLLCWNWLLVFLQGENSWGFEELAWEEYSSHCCHWWGADFGARRSGLSGKFYQEFVIKKACW